MDAKTRSVTERTILERVEDVIEREKNRAEGVMNDSRGGENLRGHSYDCGYWEGLVYALSVINAQIGTDEHKEIAGG
jgi:hypothetical protein